MSRYLILGCRPWNHIAVDALRDRMPEHEWMHTPLPCVGALKHYTAAFVLHWNKRIPSGALAVCPFVGFHMGFLPDDRGGSPLQNLIARGDEETSLNAIRLTDTLDGGEILSRMRLSLHGTAEEIYMRADALAVELIESFVTEFVPPGERAWHETGIPQRAPTRPPFKRRTPAQSRAPAALPLLGLHDHVRMLDAEGYPAAFVEVDGYRIELTRSSLRHDAVVCDARITRIEP